MSSQSDSAQRSSPTDEAAIRTLYQQLLDCWNRRNANELAALFTEDGHQIGFDGSQYNGQAEIESAISQIFADHQTATYVGKIRKVRFLTPDVAVLRAVVGMVPPGQSDLNPAVNAIQTFVTTKHKEQWRIYLFQNTPAQFHGRPELSEALTEELRQQL